GNIEGLRTRRRADGAQKKSNEHEAGAASPDRPQHWPLASRGPVRRSWSLRRPTQVPPRLALLTAGGRMHSKRSRILSLLIGATLAACSRPAADSPNSLLPFQIAAGASQQPARIQHVVIIVQENRSVD